jgi:hypothetical protein
MRLQRSSPWLKSIQRTLCSPTRGSRRAILAVEAMEGRLSLSAVPYLPAVQKMSADFNPQPDPPVSPVHLGKQAAIIAIAPVQSRPIEDPNL